MKLSCRLKEKQEGHKLTKKEIVLLVLKIMENILLR